MLVFFEVEVSQTLNGQLGFGKGKIDVFDVRFISTKWLTTQQIVQGDYTCPFMFGRREDADE